MKCNLYFTPSTRIDTSWVKTLNETEKVGSIDRASLALPGAVISWTELQKQATKTAADSPMALD